jgi:hypothetical protein
MFSRFCELQTPLHAEELRSRTPADRLHLHVATALPSTADSFTFARFSLKVEPCRSSAQPPTRVTACPGRTRQPCRQERPLAFQVRPCPDRARPAAAAASRCPVAKIYLQTTSGRPGVLIKRVQLPARVVCRRGRSEQRHVHPTQDTAAPVRVVTASR